MRLSVSPTADQRRDCDPRLGHDGHQRPPPLLLTPKQAAEALAISPRKLWSMTASGEIPHVRMGRRCVRYPLDDLRQWIDDQKKGGQNGQHPSPRS